MRFFSLDRFTERKMLLGIVSSWGSEVRLSVSAVRAAPEAHLAWSTWLLQEHGWQPRHHRLGKSHQENTIIPRQQHWWDEYAPVWGLLPVHFTAFFVCLFVCILILAFHHFWASFPGYSGFQSWSVLCFPSGSMWTCKFPPSSSV